jgi:hypothetical protein
MYYRIPASSNNFFKQRSVTTSVADADPNPDPHPSDPYVLGPSGSGFGSICQRH